MAKFTKLPPASAMGVMIWNECMHPKTFRGGLVPRTYQGERTGPSDNPLLRPSASYAERRRREDRARKSKVR